MPCSRLYASWSARRRSVSSIARRIESVTVSAYRITVPLTLRAARPIVWMSERAERRKPSLSASRIADQRHLRQVEPLAQQVDADQHVEQPLAEIADDLDALDRLDVRVDVAHLDADVLIVVGQILGHLLGERRHQHALAGGGTGADLVEQIVDLLARRPHLDPGSMSPVGRMSCSTTRPRALLELVVARRRRHVDRSAPSGSRTRRS